MPWCARCGHALGIGRFCTNCGHSIEQPVAADDEWQTDTAERPAAGAADRDAPDPALPPPVFGAPARPRFPLFADEASPDAPARETETRPGYGAEWPGEAPVLPPGPMPTRPRQPRPSPGHPREPRNVLPLMVALLVLLLVFGGAAGVVLLLRSDDAAGTAADDPSSGPEAPGSSASDPGGTTPSEDTSTAADETPDPAPDTPRDVAAIATAIPPDTAAPSRDVDGNAVRYQASYMLDGQPDTAWRMNGSGAGLDVVFQLDAPTRLTRVGLINGYAKVVPGYNGYAANRRITAVEWSFDDGTTIRQSLRQVRRLQTVKVDKVVTSSVTLRMLEVTKPAKGPAGRNFTAISDVSLVGRPTS